MHKWVLWTHCRLVLLGFGVVLWTRHWDEDEVDYSKYLGPDWKKNKFKGKRVSTIVSNHISFLEIPAWMSNMTPPAFTPGSHVKKLPIGDHYCCAINSMYIDRNASKEVLDQQVQAVIDRQKLTENDEYDWGPLAVFAEGTVTNGQNLARFRRGGFVAGVAVQPCWFKYDYKTISPDYATIQGLEQSLI